MPRLLPEGKRLTGRQIKTFHEDLLDAFDLERFRKMLVFELDKKLERITTKSGLETIVFDVIEHAEMESSTAELLQAARATDPRNVKLFTFAQQFGLAPETEALERTIRASNPMFDPFVWRTRLAELEAQICRVEVNEGSSQMFGTGFLLGPDIVMTNCHVVEGVIKGNVSPENVILRFGYKKLNRVDVHPGTVYHIEEEHWLLDYSPYNALEKTDPEVATPSEEELDYALLRVTEKPGEDLIGKDPNSPQRGWIPVQGIAHDFQIDTFLAILQHPEGAPLKLAFDTQAVIGLKGKTRVRYRTNTEGGSSGSPCFDADWNLIALHHLGDPNFSAPTYNQGIPFTVILDLLEKREKKHLLG